MTEVKWLIKISEFLKVISIQIISPPHHPIERSIPKIFIFIIIIHATDYIIHCSF